MVGIVGIIDLVWSVYGIVEILLLMDCYVVSKVFIFFQGMFEWFGFDFVIEYDGYIVLIEDYFVVLELVNLFLLEGVMLCGLMVLLFVGFVVYG